MVPTPIPPEWNPALRVRQVFIVPMGQRHHTSVPLVITANTGPFRQPHVATELSILKQVGTSFDWVLIWRCEMKKAFSDFSCYF